MPKHHVAMSDRIWYAWLEWGHQQGLQGYNQRVTLEIVLERLLAIAAEHEQCPRRP